MASRIVPRSVKGVLLATGAGIALAAAPLAVSGAWASSTPDPCSAVSQLTSVLPVALPANCSSVTGALGSITGALGGGSSSVPNPTGALSTVTGALGGGSASLPNPTGALSTVTGALGSVPGASTVTGALGGGSSSVPNPTGALSTVTGALGSVPGASTVTGALGNLPGASTLNSALSGLPITASGTVDTSADPAGTGFAGTDAAGSAPASGSGTASVTTPAGDGSVGLATSGDSLPFTGEPTWIPVVGGVAFGLAGLAGLLMFGRRLVARRSI